MTKEEILDYHTLRIGEAAKKQGAINAMNEYGNMIAKEAIIYTLNNYRDEKRGSINDFINKFLQTIK